MPGFSANNSVFFGRSAVDESARIQTLRGVACLLLVAFHVVGVDSTAGLRFSDDSLPRLATNLLIHIRMPLFAFLSGFVYAYRPIAPGHELAFARRKLLRLLVPLLTVSTAFFLAQLVTPGINMPVRLPDIWRIYVLPYQHFWFLQAIIVVFAATVVLERLRLLSTGRCYLSVMLVAILLQIFGEFEPDIFSASKAGYLSVFFWLGLGANRFRQAFSNRLLRAGVLLAFAAAYAIFVHMLLTNAGESTDRRALLALVISASAVLGLLYVFPRNYWLARVGGFSFSIYLYHVFFTAGSRIAMHAAGAQRYPALLFTVGVLAGVAGPIAIQLVAHRHAATRRFLLGES
jgi:peptidoglycan/LPS O-acetylase OafA/YrhL